MPIFGGIFVGRRFGAFDSTPAGGRVDDAVGPAFPPAGSYNSTLYGVTYPDDQGGATFYFAPNDTVIPSQTCDVDVLNDGNGGTYTYWASATNINYVPQGTHIYTDINVQDAAGFNSVEVPEGSGSFFDPEYVNPTYEHDGNGGYQSGAAAGPYLHPQGTVIYSPGNNQTEVPTGSGNWYDNGTYNQYVWNGSGGYSESTGGAFNTGVISEYVASTGNYVEVPGASGNYFDTTNYGDRYTWDGSGGYNYTTVWYFDHGTFITNDGTYDYYWDGDGGYYSL